MFHFLKQLFKRKPAEEEIIPKPDIERLIEQVKMQEQGSETEPGRKIHEFDYGHFTLRLDRDITKNYRITVSYGNERIYSFSVLDDQHLEHAYHEVIKFLGGSRSLSRLPNSEKVKGFFFGQPGD